MDEASIHLAERDFPRVHIRWHQAGGFNVYCFENEQSLGQFLVTGLEFSPSSNRIEVIFDIGHSEFEEVQRVIDIISGKSVTRDEYLIACSPYIELNPLRAGLVAHPKDYRWSSYQRRALGMQDRSLDEDPW